MCECTVLTGCVCEQCTVLTGCVCEQCTVLTGCVCEQCTVFTGCVCEQCTVLTGCVCEQCTVLTGCVCEQCTVLTGCVCEQCTVLTGCVCECTVLTGCVCEWCMYAHMYIQCLLCTVDGVLYTRLCMYSMYIIGWTNLYICTVHTMYKWCTHICTVKRIELTLLEMEHFLSWGVVTMATENTNSYCISAGQLYLMSELTALSLE